jgi:hypothetical protein
VGAEKEARVKAELENTKELVGVQSSKTNLPEARQNVAAEDLEAMLGAQREEEARLDANLEKAHEEAIQKATEGAKQVVEKEARLKAELAKTKEMAVMHSSKKNLLEARKNAATEDLEAMLEGQREEEARLDAILEKPHEEATPAHASGDREGMPLLQKPFSEMQRSSQVVSDSSADSAKGGADIFQIEAMSKQLSHRIADRFSDVARERAIRKRAEIEKRAEQEVAQIVSHAAEEVREVSFKARQEVLQEATDTYEDLLSTDTSVENFLTDSKPKQKKLATCCITVDGKHVCYYCNPWNEFLTFDYTIPIHEGVAWYIVIFTMAPFAFWAVRCCYYVAGYAICLAQTICCTSLILLLLFIYMFGKTGEQWWDEHDNPALLQRY